MLLLIAYWFWGCTYFLIKLLPSIETKVGLRYHSRFGEVVSFGIQENTKI